MEVSDGNHVQWNAWLGGCDVAWRSEMGAAQCAFTLLGGWLGCGVTGRSWWQGVSKKTGSAVPRFRPGAFLGFFSALTTAWPVSGLEV